ncbi:Peroxisomal multifunctional enzyme type 2, partial [Pseudolycoriella hygida]
IGERFVCQQFFRRYAHVIHDGRGPCNEHYDSRFVLNLVNPKSVLKLDKTTATKYRFPKFSLKYSLDDVVQHRATLGIEEWNPELVEVMRKESKNVQVPPSFALVFSNFIMLAVAKKEIMIKDRTVHVNQVIDMFRPLKSEGVITYELKVVDILDKGKGTLLTYNLYGRDEHDNELFFLQNKFYQLNISANETDKQPTKKTVEPVKRLPDQIFEFKTEPFDLTWFSNPTPDDMKEPLFSPNHFRQYHDITHNFQTEPICHGRYYIGMVMNQLLTHYGGGDLTSLKRLETRLTHAVGPSQTLVTNSWKIAEQIHFETGANETGKLVLQVKNMSFLRIGERFVCQQFFRRYAHVIHDGRGPCNEHYDSRFVLNLVNPKSVLKLDKTTATKYRFPKFSLKYSLDDVVQHRATLGIEEWDPELVEVMRKESKNVQVPPSFALVFSNFIMLAVAKKEIMIKDRTVHVNQVIDMFRPLKSEGVITYELKVVDILDKGKGTLLTYNLYGRDEHDNELFFLQNKFYQLNISANETDKQPTKKTVEPVKRLPDQIFEFKTEPFDLTWFSNPTPDDMKEPLFSPNHFRQYHDITHNFQTEPICHGRYYIGMVMNQLLTHYGGGDLTSLKRLETRLTHAVGPSQTLVTNSWKIAEQIHFETGANETGKLVLQVGIEEWNPELVEVMRKESKNVQVPPSFALVFSNFIMLAVAKKEIMIKDRTVHVNQVIDMFRPLKSEGVITYELKVVDILDKEKGTLATYNLYGRDEHDNELFFLQNKFYQLNISTNETDKQPTKKTVEPVKRLPDQIFQFKTEPFDLTWFSNPTPDDMKEPLFSPNHFRQYHDIMHNFQTEPICHGRYCIGIVMNQLLTHYGGGDLTSLKRLETRLTHAVGPSQTLVTNSWKIAEQIHFETVANETGKFVL